MTAAVAAHGDAFVRVDARSGLFTGTNGPFHMLSVTYVQPEEGRPGMNAGPITPLDFDFTKFRADFRQMRGAGVNAIYMRVAAGTFLTPDGEWRRLDDPLHGVLDPVAKRADLDRRLAAAAAAGLEPFASAAREGRSLYAFEVFDYLLDCAEAEGIYVVPAICDNWGMPRKYDLQEELQSLAYPDVWNKAIADWVKIVGRWRDRTVVAGYLVEGEMFRLHTWDENMWQFMAPGGPVVVRAKAPVEHDDPALRTQFQDYLRWKYGTVDQLKDAWGNGYDRSRVTWEEATGIPRYPYGPEAFAHITDFGDIRLPTVERIKGDSGPGIADSGIWWRNVPFDPVWTDFGYFKEWLYTTRLTKLIDALRGASPNHLFFHSASCDYVLAWHPFYVTWAHKRMPFDVLLHGGGYSKAISHMQASHTGPFEAPCQDTVLELYQTVGPYRPAARSLGRAFGMGEGGWAIESNNPRAADLDVCQTLGDRWIAMLLMDNFGSGAAYANIWDWGVLTGSTPSVPQLHEHKVVDSMRALMQAIDGRSFTRQNQARVLILMNGPTLHGNMKPLEYDNMIAVSYMLASAHVAFDISTTDEIAPGPSEDRLDISGYDLILMPQQFHVTGPQLSRAQTGDVPDVWDILGHWLADRPGRVLCAGAVGSRDSFSNPIDTLPESLRTVLGGMSPGPLRKAVEGITVTSANGDSMSLPVKDLYVQDITLCDATDAEPWLTRGEKIHAARRNLGNGSRVVLCGFPLGFSWMFLPSDPLTGAALADRARTEQAAPLLRALLDMAGISPDYKAPPHVLTYASDDGRALLVRKRHDEGDRTVTVSLGLPEAFAYSNGETTVERRGQTERMSFTCTPGENLACVADALAKLELLGDGTATARFLSAEDGRIMLRINNDQTLRVTCLSGNGQPFDLPPGTHEISLP